MNQVPALLLFGDGQQLNLRVPQELDGQSEATVYIDGNPRVTLPVLPAHPGLAPLVFHSDLTVNSAANPARPGDTIVLFATGEGRNPRLDLRIGGIVAEILSSSPPAGIDGVLQIHARIPTGVSSGQVPTVLGARSIDIIDSPPVMLAIR